MFLLPPPLFILSEHPVRFPPVSEGVPPPPPLPSAPDMIASLWSSPAVGFASPCALLWHSFCDDSVLCLFESHRVRVPKEPTLRVRSMVTQAHWHEKDDRNVKTKQGGERREKNYGKHFEKILFWFVTRFYVSLIDFSLEKFPWSIKKLPKSLPAGLSKRCKEPAKFQAAVSICQFLCPGTLLYPLFWSSGQWSSESLAGRSAASLCGGVPPEVLVPTVWVWRTGFRALIHA